MTDAFSSLISDARTFLNTLHDNNSRDWFLEHKAQYDADLKRPAELLLDQVAVDLSKATGSAIKSKLFRPHRDVRFSKDKTPYHTHLHLLWTDMENGRQPMGWFFGIGRDYLSVGAGLMGFEKETMLAWREHVGNEGGAEMAALIQSLETKGYRVAEPELKRIPAPFDKDHAHGELLRRKSLSAWRDFNANEMTDVPKDLMAVFTDLTPLTDSLKSLL